MLGYPEIQFSWVITNFSRWISYLKRRKVKIAYSPEFPSEPGGNVAKWRMVFRIDETNRQTSLFLEPVGNPPESIEVMFYFKVYAKYAMLVAGGFAVKSPSDQEFQGCENLLTLRDLLFWTEFHDNIVTIACEIVNQQNFQMEATSSSVEIQKFHMAYAKLNTDMAKLLEMDKYGDVELVVGNRNFNAYKGILAARSSVFADMFNTRSINRFEITDIKPELFQVLLRYIYTDWVSDLPTMKFKLFPVAKRYNIGSLKQLCQDAIISGLSRETIVDALKTGFDEPEIKQRALAFIWAEKPELAQLPGWAELDESYPYVAFKTRLVVELAVWAARGNN